MDKRTAVVVALVSGIPIAWQWRENRSLHRQLERESLQFAISNSTKSDRQPRKAEVAARNTTTSLATLPGSERLEIDMHPARGGWDDHSLQPGETYSDRAGDVHITNLGRGGASPNEYIDVQINKGAFAGNQAPEPTWDAPATWETGVPLTITVTPNDPDGDDVSCMWTTADKAIPHNQSSTTLTRNWELAGSYQVKVVVSDMKGQTATLSRHIVVSGGRPVTFADATFGPWSTDVSKSTWNADVLVDGEQAAHALLDVTDLTGDFDITKTNVSGANLRFSIHDFQWGYHRPGHPDEHPV